MRRRSEDVAGRSVISLEPDDLRARKVVLEAQNVVDLGAAPAVDRLIVIADAAVFFLRGRGREPRVLPPPAGGEGGGGGGRFRRLSLTRRPLTRRILALLGRVDLSPQAGRG